ncbi:DUF664 domain-containing protein [Tenacibaculum sp. TC6]|uniref:mycothiol transferase n=1 Tax=Tenacibaculum sp. TC6 TaxID=3423223 RepID=UPI003D35AAC5
MKNILFVLTVLFFKSSFGQTTEVSRDWTSFVQSVDISVTSKKKFKLIANVKVEPADEKAWAGLWVRVDTKNAESGFFDNMSDRPIKTNKWGEYVIEGTINENSKTLNFGGLCLYNGKFLFDNFRLSIEDDNGKFQNFPILNASFEKEVENNVIKSWSESIYANRVVRVKEYKITSSTDAFNGKKSLLIEGTGIELPNYEPGKIGKEKTEIPQIENMISMLEDLKTRVERSVKVLNQQQTDYLHDEKANRIGALVMHLAAAEIYYQKFTFGTSYVDKENEKLLGAGMDLDDEGRNLLKGKPIDYYLDIYDKVRKKTIEELRNRDDQWLNSTNAGNSISNHYAWFHVMEHQSSHLGQILFLKKRLPKFDNKVNLKKQIKN